MDNAKMIALDRLHDSPFQPRNKYNKIDELAASMKELGVLQPLLVREVESDFEIIAGHRRKRGAVKAGLAKVPCVVVEMTDVEVREAILIENGQREDVPPLEELDIYLSLRADGMEPEEIAARIGRPVGYVYRRLQLNNLCNAGQDALAAGDLGLGIAELIARLADHDVQAKAVDALSADDHSTPTISSAKGWIERNCMLMLKTADFDAEDADLIEAPACSACPKNTAVATMLFPDMEDARCTDRECFQHKRDATWAKREAAAEEKGIKILDAEATSKVFPHGYLHQSWIDLDSHDHVKGKRKKWRTIIGKTRMPQIFLVRHPINGNVFELVKKSSVKKKAKETPKVGDPWMIAADNEYVDTQALQKKQNKQFQHLFLNRMAMAVREKPLAWKDRSPWAMLAHGMVDRSWAATISLAASRRKIEIEKESHETPPIALHHWIDGGRQGVEVATNKKAIATRVELQILVMELMAVPDFGMGVQGFLDNVAHTLELDRKGIEEDAKAIADAAEEDRVDKKAAKAAGVSLEDYRNEKLKKKRTKKKTNGKKTDPEDYTKTVLGMIETGMSQTAVAKEVGLSRGQVSRIVKKADPTA
jgi:ParB/RepB/Spo0J family partition protein